MNLSISWRKEQNCPRSIPSRDTVKVIEIEGIKVILQHTVKKAIDNKVFINDTIDDYTVGPLTEPSSSEANRNSN
jgi:hypothetical protein